MISTKVVNIPTGFGHVLLGFGGNGLAFPGASTFGIDQGGGADPADVAETIYNGFAATVLTQLTDDITFEVCRVKFGPNTTGPSAEFFGAETGGSAGAGSPSNCAYLLRKNSTLGGREGRGRMYLPGVIESTTGSDGAIDPGQRASIQDDVDAFVGALALAGLPMVILHSSATPPTPVTTVEVQANIATQRRRLRR